MAEDVAPHFIGHQCLLASIWLAFEELGGGALSGQGKGGEGVHDEVHPEQLQGTHGTLTDADGGDEGEQNGHHVDGELELQELGDAVVHVAAPHDSLDNASKVVVNEDDVTGLLGNISPGYPLWEGQRADTAW